MKNINIAISLVSIAIIAWLGFTGGNIQLHSLEIGYDSRSSKMWMHPTWIVEVDNWHSCGNGWFNVAIIDRNCIQDRDYLIPHELNHTYQWRGLGAWIIAAHTLERAFGWGTGLNIEGMLAREDYDRIAAHADRCH